MHYTPQHITYLAKLFRKTASTGIVILAIAVLALPGCKKLVAISEPVNSITTNKVFSSDAQANAAMAGVFTQIINNNRSFNQPTYGFGSGLSTLLGGLSSDELLFPSNSTYYSYSINRLSIGDAPATTFWTSAYNTVYGSNAVMEGVKASTSSMLHDSVRTVLTGEAKFTRAFAYFYLINFFGDVPLVLTTDYTQTVQMSRTPKAAAYQQIVEDLKDAQTKLPADYSTGGGERFRPNKWAATALLARVYLYTGEYANAATQAGDVIGRQALYDLAPLGNVFLKNSQEAIWQLQQSSGVSNLGTATPEGSVFIPAPLTTGIPRVLLSESLQNAFEINDQRKTTWTGSSNPGTGNQYFAYKYKTGPHNLVVGGTPTEYYMALRLAEQYLIRAEAFAKGAPGGLQAAIKDLNKVRQRAGLGELALTLSQEQTLTAIAHERQTELFAEWGHRWFDLKRTGKAKEVLSVLPLKQPWSGDYQFLYPIPISETQANTNILQNDGYK
jgi:hypothetical protein